MIVQIVRFRSRMADEQVLETYRARAGRYLEQPGLAEKYYLQFRDTGEHGAVYVWESEEAMERFRSSDLARSIPEAYSVDGSPEVTIADVAMTLRSSLSGTYAAAEGAS